jgi:hypothetical protein
MGKLEFTFATIELRGVCESRRKAIVALGAEVAHDLAERLADLSALGTVAEFFDLFPEGFEKRSATECALKLKEEREILFCAGHVKVPKIESGETDWAKVTRIKIIRVG